MKVRPFAAAVVLFVFVSPALFAGYRISSWIPGWGNENLISTQQNAGRMSESNPTWYRFNADGTLALKSAAEDPTWRAAMSGTELLPAIQNTTSSGFDRNLAVTVLSTSTSRESHAQEILQKVLNQAYDGIDIDYERLPASSKENFTAFLTVLASKLHLYGKKLSVTVYAKTSDASTWDGPGGQDYAAIGAIADSVKIMAYDYSYSGSPAGPITPLAWLDQVLTYAEANIPAAKIMVGLPFYGYDWQGTAAAGVTYTQATATALAQSATITRDVNGEATYSYSNRTVFFQDLHSYNRKVDLVLQNHPNVAGFAHWANGQEDPAVWTRIEALKNGTVPPPPGPAPVPVPADLSNPIPQGSVWRYLDNGSDPGTAWRGTTFDHSTWRSGAAQLGYGDGDEATVIGFGSDSSNKYVTTYFRYAFRLDDSSVYSGLTLKIQRDDGAVVYVNGTEVVRTNMPTGVIGYRTYAAGDASSESTFYEYSIDPALLVNGTNVVAVEVHQSTPGSSDVSFNLGLSGTLGTTPPPPLPNVLPAPGGLLAAAMSGSRIDLTWTDNSTDETGFTIERCTGSTCIDFAPIATVAANVGAYSDNGLSRRTAYRYRVRAFNATGTSDYSAIAGDRTHKR